MKCSECVFYWEDADGYDRCHCEGPYPCEDENDDKYFYPGEESFDDWVLVNDEWEVQ